MGTLGKCGGAGVAWESVLPSCFLGSRLGAAGPGHAEWQVSPDISCHS